MKAALILNVLMGLSRKDYMGSMSDLRFCLAQGLIFLPK